jgi:hypothetical protein
MLRRQGAIKIIAAEIHHDKGALDNVRPARNQPMACAGVEARSAGVFSCSKKV